MAAAPVNLNQLNANLLRTPPRPVTDLPLTAVPPPLRRQDRAPDSAGGASAEGFHDFASSLSAALNFIADDSTEAGNAPLPHFVRVLALDFF